MSKEILSPEIKEKKSLPKDRALSSAEYSEQALSDMDRMIKLIAGGLAIPELKTKDDGTEELRIYDALHKNILFYTDLSWQINYLLKDREILD